MGKMRKKRGNGKVLSPCPLLTGRAGCTTALWDSVIRGVIFPDLSGFRDFFLMIKSSPGFIFLQEKAENYLKKKEKQWCSTEIRNLV